MRAQPHRQRPPLRGSDGAVHPPAWAALTAGLAAVLLIIGGGLLFFGGGFTASGRSRPVRLLVNCDISGSMTTLEKQEGLGLVESTFTSILPEDSRLTFWAFAGEVWELYDGKPLLVRELWPLLDRIRDARASRGGTSPVAVLERNIAAAQASSERGERSAVLLLWDGEDYQPERTRSLARRLAAIPGLAAVWVASLPDAIGSGADPRDEVRRGLGVLGERLILSGRYDRKQGVDRFRSLIQEPGTTERGAP